MRLAFRLLAALLFASGLFSAAAQAGELRYSESVLHEPINSQDWLGRGVRGEMLVTVFRPEGAGPFPLVVINHGRDSQRRDAVQRYRFESASRYFLSRGFAVAVPTRLGYGASAAAGDPENISNRCALSAYEPALDAAGAQIARVVERLRQETWIDPQHLILLGQSVGGLGSLAGSARGIVGITATINFAGGHGGDAELHPGQPCNPEALAEAFRQFGAQASSPSLWLYTENDRLFAPEWAQRWHGAYTAAGGRAELRLLPAFGDNGHALFARGEHIWQPILDDFLARLGLRHAHRIVGQPTADQKG
ncbi:S9 family peptidase [Uliginosibacterium sp. TH139]|uniref:alpha/beta hydrolase family protein n=1 Tax=Uliginosibacterium sp. TH139 TaxID=2067453 RepID=UPI000C7C048E|nr:dienelactone hydrolase [Uliginosibacterium sp. TH139]PLK49605.1 dienelactone hydrolase [Uliginosibacterium sp. TH139]